VGASVSEGAGHAVRVLDIRSHGSDQSFLDKLDKSTAHRQGLTDRVVVIDNTGSLMDNHDRYQRLVSLTHVRAVICVAVGPLAQAGEIVLRQSAAFASAGVTLWVGDEWGSRWAGGTDRPRPITPDGTPNLPDLIAALSSPQVFDEVFDTVRHVPHQAVCPGLAIVHPSVAAEELRFLRTQALDDLVQHTAATAAWPPAPVSTREGEPIDPKRDVIGSGTPLGESRHELGRVIKSVTASAAELPRLRTMLFGRVPVDDMVRSVATAGDVHLDRVDDLLAQLDRHSTGQTGADRLTRMGVPAPDPSDHPALAADLRKLVVTGLRAGYSLRDLSTHLRGIANQTVSAGSSATQTELVSLRENLLDTARNPTQPRVWPLPMGLVAAAAVLTAAAAAWLSAWTVPGVAVGLVWVVLIALLLFRLPGRAPGLPLADQALVLGLGMVTCAVAILATALPSAGVPLGGAVVFALAGAAIALGVTAVAWRHITTGWVHGLRLAETRNLFARAQSIVDERVCDHVRTLEHRTRLSDAALLVASGATELARLYIERATRDRAHGSAAHGPVAAELLTVLRGDLVALTMRALDDYLHAIGTDAPLATDPARLVADAGHDLAVYQAFLDTHGIHAQPPMVEDESARESLSLALWRRSDSGRRVLRGDGREELTQLCEAGDIRVLNASWHDVRILRFASAQVQRTLLGAGTAVDVITTDTDMVGMLRLVPLVTGRVVHEHPAATISHDPDGRNS
jgi:hypothetical protein